VGKLQATLKDDSAKHEQKEKYTSRTNGTFGFARNTSQRFAKPKEPFFCHRTDNNDYINSLENMRN